MTGSSGRRDEWEGRYQRGATAWDRGGASPALIHWLETGRLRPCRILVPGAGHGHEVALLAARGFEVTAVDVAPSAVQTMRAILDRAGVSADVVEADLLRWEPPHPFEAIYEQTSICALEPTDWPEYVHRLHRWLEPGGRLFALFMQTGQEGGPPYHCDVARMGELFDTRRWEWSHEAALEVPHPTGLHEIGYVLRRR